jgi:uncharacterized protein YacL
MLDVLFNNFVIIGGVCGLFMVCVLANITASVYYNTKTLKQDFSVAKLVDGLLKMLFIALTAALLSIVISAIPYMPYFRDFIAEQYKDVICLASIVFIIAGAVVKYFKEALATLADILENRNIIEDINDVSATKSK